MTEEGACIRRRRECLECSRRFTTYERFEENRLMVIKKDSRRESFDRQKLLSGILKAVEKRPIPIENIEMMVLEIEREIKNRGESEVSSLEIGEAVMRRLRELDDVAYVRFASVYKEFKDADSFMEELRKLREENPGEQMDLEVPSGQS